MSYGCKICGDEEWNAETLANTNGVCPHCIPMLKEKGYSITHDKRKGDRKLMLEVLVNLTIQANRLFSSFSKECCHNKGVGCKHPLYHRDFELAYICKIEDCPIVQNY